MTTIEWRQYFPFSRIRKEQEDAIEFALNAFESGKKFVLLDAPTGVGKSAIAVTIARALDGASIGMRLPGAGAYILTPQKILQEQYTKDFCQSNGLNLMASIKSATNYECHSFEGQSCGETRRILKTLNKQCGSEFDECKRNCVYKNAKDDFVNSPIGVTNFSYFLAETMYAKKLEPRNLLIADECHGIEAQLSSFIEVTFSTTLAKELLNSAGPQKKDLENVVNWIKKRYKPALNKHIKALVTQIESGLESGRDVSAYAKDNEKFDKHMCKINRFLGSFDENPGNWIMNVVRLEKNSRNKRADLRYEFKPIDVSPWADEMLYKFGNKVLLMSATILDKDAFCRTIGINADDAAYLKLASPFPVENRPVCFLPVGSMSKKNIDTSLPNLVSIISDIMAQHQDVKGIIHASTYRIATYLYDNLKSDRLLIHGSFDRDEVLQQHKLSTKPTVLISPSMTEGVDLADDASRFQIIAKVPFPYLGDEMTRKRMERDPVWYEFITARVIIQSLGRSIRNEQDHAVSYILDADWERFYRKTQKMFPVDFKDALALGASQVGS